MTENDEKIRKFWLFFLCLNSLIQISFFFWMLGFSVPESENVMPLRWKVPLVILINAGVSYLFYYFAYTKFGTKLLTFILIVSVVSWIGTLLKWMKGDLSITQLLPPAVMVAQELLGIFWFFLNWKMLRINKKLKAQAKELKASATT